MSALVLRFLKTIGFKNVHTYTEKEFEQFLTEN